VASQRVDFFAFRDGAFCLPRTVFSVMLYFLLVPCAVLATPAEHSLIADSASDKALPSDTEKTILKTNPHGGAGEGAKPVETNQNTENQSEASGAESNTAPASSKPKYVLRDAAPLPKRISSFLTGLLIGPPVATVRRTFSEDKEAANTVMYGKKSSGLQSVARVVLFPLMVVPGAIEGVSDAVENSWKYSSEQPFSKNAFSLGKLGASEE
jgi:hypothetical protein